MLGFYFYIYKYMKYLKSFTDLNESVIMPTKLNGSIKLSSYDDLSNYGKENDFDVVEYEEFYNSLSDDDKKTAPPKGVPFFALFHPINNKAMFVICDKNVINRIPNFIEIVNDIIGHENVHKEQTHRRKGLSFNLPSPTDRKLYFSNKEEIMAFSWTIANGLSKKNKDISSALKDLNTIGRGEHKQIWNDIKRICDTNVINRYKKYIYSYLENIFEI